MERKITVDDLLEERVDMAKEEVNVELVNYITENELTDCETQEEIDVLIEDLENLNADNVQQSIDHNGRINEIIGGCVPVYTYDIKTAFFLHSDRLEEAYENAGIGDNPMENDGMTAIFCYIDQEVNNDFDDIFAKAVDEVIENLKKENADLPIDDE